MEQQVERFVTVAELVCVALIATGVTQRVIVFIRLCVPRKYRNFMSLPFFQLQRIQYPFKFMTVYWSSNTWHR